MSLKENINYIKEELSSEEKLLEGSIKVERMYKKYKLLVFGILIAVIGYFIINSLIQYNTNKTIKEANIIYSSVIDNPNDTTNLEKLKELNIQLYEIALLNNNQETSITTPFLKELQEYKKAIKSNDINSIEKTIANQNFLLKDFANIQKALLLIENKEYNKAKTTLKTIPNDSQASQLVKVIEHFLITK